MPGRRPSKLTGKILLFHKSFIKSKVQKDGKKVREKSREEGQKNLSTEKKGLISLDVRRSALMRERPRSSKQRKKGRKSRAKVKERRKGIKVHRAWGVVGFRYKLKKTWRAW